MEEQTETATITTELTAMVSGSEWVRFPTPHGSVVVKESDIDYVVAEEGGRLRLWATRRDGSQVAFTITLSAEEAHNILRGNHDNRAMSSTSSEVKGFSYTFDAATDDWIVLPTHEGHALVLTTEIVQAVDMGDSEEPNNAHVVLRSESGYERTIFVQMRVEAIARLLRGGA